MVLTSYADHKKVGKKDVVAAPVDIDAVAADIIETTLDQGLNSNTYLKNYTFFHPHAIRFFYEKQGYKTAWSVKGTFTPAADSLLQFISQSRTFGLFPEDYYI